MPLLALVKKSDFVLLARLIKAAEQVKQVKVSAFLT